MTKRLQSIDLELYGVQHTFYYDPPVSVPGDDDELSVGRDVLADVCSYEVHLVQGMPAVASVDIDYTITISGSFTVDLDLEGRVNIESAEDLVDHIEMGDFEEVYEGISNDIENSLDTSDAVLTVGTPWFGDEEGNDFEF